MSERAENDATKHLDISYSRYIKMPLRKSKTPAMTEEEKKDDIKYLSTQLDDKSLRETLSYNWKMWVKALRFEVEGTSWVFKFVLWCVSVGDIVTDALSFWKFFWSGEKEDHHFIFSALTLTFIYLPSLNFISALFGARRTSLTGVVIGFVAGFIGGVFYFGYAIHCDVDTHSVYNARHAVLESLNPMVHLLGLVLFFLGLGFFFLGWVLYASSKRKLFSFYYKNCFVERISMIMIIIFLLPISPIIFLIVKLMAVFMPNCPFIQAQARMGSRGEAVLEATPQFGLQLYVVLTTLKLKPLTIFSIATSALSLSLPNIEKYVTARSQEYGFRTILTNIPVFLTFSLFKVLSVTIVWRFFNAISFGLIFIEIMLVALFMGIFKICFNLEKKWFIRGLESVFLGWLTMTNQENSKGAAFARFVSSMVALIFKSLTLVFILLMGKSDCKFLKKLIPHEVDGLHLDWSKLELMKDDPEISLPLVGDVPFPYSLEIVLFGTITLGLLSLVLDILTCRWKENGSYIFEGFIGCKCCEEEE